MWGTAGRQGHRPRSFVQARSTETVLRRRGVQRSFLPLPRQRTCAPARSSTSWLRSPASSETRSPVCRATSRRAWSRLPVQVPWSGLASAPRTLASRLGEERDHGPVVALGGDGEDPGDDRGVLGMAQGGEAEERSVRGEAGVAGPGAVVPFDFEVLQEGADQRGVEVGGVQLGGLFAGATGGEAELQPPAVTVGGHRVGTGLALAHQPLGEERLQCGCEGGHGRRRSARSRRCDARSSSSGTADRYRTSCPGWSAPGTWTAMACGRRR